MESFIVKVLLQWTGDKIICMWNMQMAQHDEVREKKALLLKKFCSNASGAQLFEYKFVTIIFVLSSPYRPQ